jgi:cytochrome c oxidase cbb3-type subunit 4
MITTLQIVWTLLSFAVFLGIVIWACGRGRRAQFDAAARAPLRDDVYRGDESNG